MEQEFEKFTPEQDEILEDTTSMEEKLEEGFAVKSSEATDEEINESGRLVANDRAND